VQARVRGWLARKRYREPSTLDECYHSGSSSLTLLHTVKQARMRSKVAREIYETEASYVKALDVIVDVRLAALSGAHVLLQYYLAPAERTGMIKEKDIEIVCFVCCAVIH
jgi:hypothetical protein